MGEDIKLLVTIVVAILSGIFGHWLSSSRDATNKRRDLRIQYLLEVYRKLESSSSRGSNQTKEYESNVEDAIADIQLLGTKEQIKELMEFLKNFKVKETSIKPVLELLRKNLRKELDLEKDIPEITIQRF